MVFPRLKSHAMLDRDKTKQQLLSEIQELRDRLQADEASQSHIAERERVTAELEESARLNDLLLNTLPYPSMLIRRKDRVIVAANRIAKEMGARVGDYCWRSFAQSRFIPGDNKAHADALECGGPAKGGPKCLFCLSDEAFDLDRPISNPEMPAFGRLWSTWWIPVNSDLYLHYAIDITDQKRLEEELRKSHEELENRVRERTIELTKANEALKASEELFRAMFENNLAVKLLIDPDTGAIVRANPAACEVYGYPAEQLTRMKITDINMLSETSISEEMKRARRQEHNHFFFKHRLSSGEIRDVEVYSSPLHFKGRKLLYSIIHDITESRLAEERLKKSEESYRQLVERANAIILRLDTKGRIDFINEYARSFFGYSEEEIVGKHAVGTVVPNIDSLGRDLEGMIEDVISHPERYARNENENMLKNGGRVWIAWANQAIFDEAGNFTGVLCIGNDRTDKRRAEEANLRLAAIVESSNDAIIGRTLEGVITSWNHAAEKIYGYAAKEVTGQAVALILPPEGAEEFMPFLKRAARGEQIVNYEAVGVRKDGKHIDVSITISPIVAPSGEIMGASSIHRDISEQRRIEKERQDYMKKLEAANLELQEFASVASHDLREPLRKVQKFSDLLIKVYSTALNENGKDYLQRMQNAAKRMEALLDALLEYSRITTKANPFLPADLGALVQEVLSDLEVLIEQKGATITIGSFPIAEVDPRQFTQLLQNLISNGLKYNKSDKPEIRVFSEILKDCSCNIYVEDNGIGFDEEYIDKIFEPFQRLHGRNSEFQGTGIGLAICRKIAERHGGTITAKSTPGKGSTFIVTIPLQRGDCAHDTP